MQCDGKTEALTASFNLNKMIRPVAKGKWKCTSRGTAGTLFMFLFGGRNLGRIGLAEILHLLWRLHIFRQREGTGILRIYQAQTMTNEGRVLDFKNSGFEPFHIKSTSDRAQSIPVRAEEAGDTRKVLKTVRLVAAEEKSVDVGSFTRCGWNLNIKRKTKDRHCRLFLLCNMFYF